MAGCGPDKFRHLTDEQIRGVFHARGLRFTRQRASIYRALVSTSSHPTAEELFQFVRAENPQVSLATIYNTLDVLASSGLCRRLPGAAASSACRYDADTHSHVHLVNESGEIVDVPPELGGALLDRLSPETVAAIERELGVQVTQIEVRLVGRTDRAARRTVAAE